MNTLTNFNCVGTAEDIETLRFCEECVNCKNSKYCKRCVKCDLCETCIKCTECTECQKCTNCTGLTGASYMIDGKQYSATEYEQQLRIANGDQTHFNKPVNCTKPAQLFDNLVSRSKTVRGKEPFQFTVYTGQKFTTGLAALISQFDAISSGAIGSPESLAEALGIDLEKRAEPDKMSNPSKCNAESDYARHHARLNELEAQFSLYRGLELGIPGNDAADTIAKAKLAELKQQFADEIYGHSDHSLMEPTEPRLAQPQERQSRRSIAYYDSKDYSDPKTDQLKKKIAERDDLLNEHCYETIARDNITAVAEFIRKSKYLSTQFALVPDNYKNLVDKTDYQSAIQTSYYYAGNDETNCWMIVGISNWLAIQQDFAQYKNLINKLELEIQEEEQIRVMRLPTCVKHVCTRYRVVAFEDDVLKSIFIQLLGKNEHKPTTEDILNNEYLEGFMYLTEPQFKLYNFVKAIGDLATPANAAIRMMGVQPPATTAAAGPRNLPRNLPREIKPSFDHMFDGLPELIEQVGGIDQLKQMLDRGL